MFYYVSKILWFFATPSNLIPSLALLGLVLIWAGYRRAGSGLAAVALVGLFGAGLSPLANWVIGPLEQRFPAFQEDGARIDGVVVLGGAVEAEESLGRDQLAVNEAAERVLAMADLARRYPSAKILFSGGGATLVATETPEAAAVERFVETLGIAKDRVIFEDRSRTTYENAVFSRDIAQPKPGERWLLVTSAWHMPRAVGCFRQAGFSVLAYPVDFRTRRVGDNRPFSFMSLGLRRLDLGTKEWAGLAGYRLAGYTDALLPAPEPASAIR